MSRRSAYPAGRSLSVPSPAAARDDEPSGRAAAAEARHASSGAGSGRVEAGPAGTDPDGAEPDGTGPDGTGPDCAGPDRAGPDRAGSADAGPVDGALPPPEGETAVTLDLVRRAQAGDADAFGELYDRYVDLVYRFVHYRVGSTQVAEDLTSETFLRALRRITSFTWQGRDVGAWFITIARNLVADHYKSSRQRLELSTDDVTTVGGSPRLVEDGPERAVLQSMQNAVLLQAVRQLGSEQRECIVLRFLQGLSVAETAAAMGKNDGSIKALQYRAVRSLGRLLPEGLEL